MSVQATTHPVPPAPARNMKLAELLGALSYAIDLTEGQPAGHCIRGCWIGMHIGRAAGLNDQQLWELYYTLLLKDSGCSSNAERLCQLFLADDLAVKRDFKTMDGSAPQFLKFVLTHTATGEPFRDRLRTIIDVVRNTDQMVHDLIDTRCHAGAQIARQLRFPEPVAEAIVSLDEHWDGKGAAQGLTGEQIPVYARIALMAQVTDVYLNTEGRETTIEQVARRSGTWFDPDLVDIFKHVADDDGFWAMLASPRIEDEVLALDPAASKTVVDDEYLDDIAGAFAGIVDAKSSFTAGHSKRVACYTDMIAGELGLGPEHRRMLRRAALLHDLGKLGVSNAILDKPGKLDEDEWAQIRMHTIHSAEVLSRIEVLSDLVPVARSHHERLDGSGYPDGLKGDRIGLDVRIAAVADTFDALTADRPYRQALPRTKAFEIMDEEAGPRLDAECYRALKSALEKSENPA